MKKKKGELRKKAKGKEKSVLRQDVKKHIATLLLFVFALFFSLSLFGQAGAVGRWVDRALTVLFGWGRYFLPFLLIFWGAVYFRKIKGVSRNLVLLGGFLLFVSLLGLLDAFYEEGAMKELAKIGLGGGYVGLAVAFSLVKLIGRIATVVSLFAFALIGFMLAFNVPVLTFLGKWKDFWRSAFSEEGKSEDGLENEGGKEEVLSNNSDEFKQLSLESDLESENRVDYETDSGEFVGEGDDQSDSKESENESKNIPWWKKLFSKEARREAKLREVDDNIKSWEVVEEDDEMEKDLEDKDTTIEDNFDSIGLEEERADEKIMLGNVTLPDKKKAENQKKSTVPKKRPRLKWRRPPLSIFAKTKRVKRSKDTEANIALIQRTLKDFGIKVEPSGYNIGPTVTQYQFIPPAGVMLSKIVSLQHNLALALKAYAIRIEAPIPGTSLIGIEVPNKEPTMVRLGSIFGREEFLNSPGLSMALGEDVNGNYVIAPLDKMPHLLVAGSTNTGKSVCVNAILSSLIFKNSPDDLQLILVDPKRVELSSYSGVPHLLTDVITDMDKVVNVLKWATIEMDERYKKLAEVGSRNIVSYNEKVGKGATRKVVNQETGEANEEPLERMPYIVIVIDELADLMSTHGKEVEGLITRLSQMARAVGIHLVLSTQRPDTNVITGTIKNNIPGRIAFRVGGNVDSRTILDAPGAEKLLGNGDMLYIGPGYPQPVRIQGPFVSEQETRKLISFVKRQAKKLNFERDAELKDSLEEKLEETVVSGDVREGENSADDVLYEQAKEIVLESRKASVSFLQRALRIGYNRAARIMEMLEKNEVVGPARGSQPRKILLPAEQMTDVVSGPEDDMEIQAERDKREF